MENNNSNGNESINNDNVSNTGTVLQEASSPAENSDAQITRKKFPKKILAGVIAAVIVIGVFGTVFAKSNLFKSNMEIAMAATTKSFSKYINVDGKDNTIFSKVFNAKIAEKAVRNPNFDASVKINATINKCSALPKWAENMGGELNINVAPSSREESFDIKGVFNNFDFDIVNAYVNEEYLAFDVPIANEKFFMRWEDAPAEAYNIIKQLNGESGENLDELMEAERRMYTFMNAFGTEFINTVTDELELDKSDSEKVGGRDCNVYKISMNNNDIKDFVKIYLNNLFANDDVFDTLEWLMSREGYGGMLNKDMLLRQISMGADYIDVYGIDAAFYTDGKDLIKMEVNFKTKEDEGYICAFSFLGIDNPADNFEAELYEYEENKYKSGFLITDNTSENGEEINNQKVFSFIESKDDNKVDSVSINTVYNPATSVFRGSVDCDTKDALSGTVATFNGNIKSDADIFELNFDELSINYLGEELINLSFGLRASELQEKIKAIDTDEAIDIINEPESLEEALEKIGEKFQNVGSGIGL